MDNLGWVFSLYAVVLALALVEVLTGLARAIRQRHSAVIDGQGEVRLGLLTPLLAVFLMLDMTSFWVVAWALRDVIPVTPLVLASGLFITSLYYVAASWVFPEPDARVGDLDAHFFRQKKLIFALVFTSNLVAYLGRGWLQGTIGLPGAIFYDYALLASYYMLQFAGILVNGKRANLVILTGLILVTLEWMSLIGWRAAHAIF